MDQKTTFLSSLLPELSEVEDFRVLRNRLYPLNELLFLTISAVISGCKHWEEIADFGSEKLDWLRKYLPFEHGSPSHDTLNRVFSNLDYRGFESCFMSWVSHGLTLPKGAIINIDGKKICRSATKQEQQLPRNAGGKGAVHLVQAWCSELQLCLGQYQVEGKSNEITAIPALLELLELEGAVITIDAIGCQKKITEQIVEHGADYLIGLKANQKTLMAQSLQLIADNNADSVHNWENKGHGREEMRTCSVFSAQGLAGGVKDEWAGISAVVQIHSVRKVVASGKVSEDKRLYITSLEAGAERLNQVVRGHWAIENQLHWSLDVQFGEDYSTKRQKNAAQNFGVALRMSLSLLKANSKKISVNRKILKCARSDQYREEIMNL